MSIIDCLRRLAKKAGAKPTLAVRKKYEKSITFINMDARGEVDFEEV